ncbi:hypothetical protein GGD41_001256 [Paraburkholderia bryophila]|uniref:Uncharacterized protein n=1 Tax=Paraburkholderia bryophila TaxID=420952 RepID=A0A7Z0AYS8_9BURK|nr:hypothetical protein [Paraburkholderia bryophila]
MLMTRLGLGRPARHQIRTLQRMRVDRRPAARRQQRTAGPLPPCTRKRRQTGNGAHGIAAAAHSLQAVVHPDRGLLRAAVESRKIDDHVLVDATNLGDARWRIAQRTGLQLSETHGMFGDVRMIEQVLRDQHVHHAERQRAVRAGFQRNVLMAFFRGQRTIRIDRDQPCAPPLGLLGARPEMQVRRDRIRAPDQDDLALGEELGQHADARAVGVFQPGCAGRGADSTVQLRRAEFVEEPLGDAVALNQTHRSGVAVRQDRFRGAAGNLGQAGCGEFERLIPTDRFKTTLAFTADALHWRSQTTRMMHPLRIAADFGTQRALRRRMIGIADHLDRPTIFHGDAHRAGVRAIVGTHGAGEFSRSIHGRSVEESAEAMPDFITSIGG